MTRDELVAQRSETMDAISAVKKYGQQYVVNGVTFVRPSLAELRKDLRQIDNDLMELDNGGNCNRGGFGDRG